METTETPTDSISAQKEALMAKANQFRNRLDSQVSDLKSNAAQAGKTALLIGGGALLAYGLVRLVSPRRSKHRSLPLAVSRANGSSNGNYRPLAASVPSGPSALGFVGRSVKAAIVSAALAFVKNNAQNWVKNLGNHVANQSPRPNQSAHASAPSAPARPLTTE